MTREEKQKAIDALEISTPVRVMTWEEFNDYIQTLNKVMDWLEQEPTKNNLGVECIKKSDAIYIIQDMHGLARADVISGAVNKIITMPSVTPQEPFINKPCVSSGVCEHDKNKVLDKLRAEIETKYGQCDICEYFEDYDYEENDISEYRPIGNIADILQIIDKYKAESEEE